MARPAVRGRPSVRRAEHTGGRAHHVFAGRSAGGDTAIAVHIVVRGRDGAVVREMAGPGSPGMHRMLWDLHTEFPFVPTASDSGYYGAPVAPYVPPGAYTVAISARGTTASETIQVRADSSALTTPSGIAARERMMMQIDSLSRAFHDGKLALAALDTEFTHVRALLAQSPKVPATDSAVTRVQKELRAVHESFSEEYGAPIGNAFDLLGGLEGSSAGPTEAEQRTLDLSTTQLRSTFAKLNELITDRDAAFARGAHAPGAARNSTGEGTMKTRHEYVVALSLLGCVTIAATSPAAAQTGARFEISFPASVHAQPITGRVFVFIAQDSTPEPRFQGGSLGANGPFFGVDVDHLAPGASARIDGNTPGFPIASLRNIPAGDYYVQAVLNVYTQMHRADGHTIWVHADQWEGQQFAESPGNLVSKARRVHIAPRASSAIRLTLSDVIPPVQISGRHEMDQAHQDPERTAHEVLGSSHLSRRRRAAAARVRRTSRMCTTPWITSRITSVLLLHITSGGTGRAGGLERRRSSRVGGESAAARRLPALSGLDLRQLPADAHGDVPASHAVLQ